MEIRRYLEIVGRRWWIAALALLATTALTVVFVVQQPWVYGASGTYVVRPRTVETEQAVRAIDTLIRGVEINSTYATIATSELIRERAKASLGDDFDASGLSVGADVITGTNALRISVSGPDPERVAAFAGAVGEETVAYVEELVDAFVLAPLDAPEVETTPIGPNKMMTAVIGAIFGLMLGVAGAVLADHIARARSETKAKKPGDEMEEASLLPLQDELTGAYTEDFFILRFNQEMSRTKHSRRSFCVGVLKVQPKADVSPEDSRDFLRDVHYAVVPLLREEDLLAYVPDHTFSLMMPDLSTEDADSVMSEWKGRVDSVIERHWASLGGVEVAAGVAAYRYDGEDVETVVRPGAAAV